MNRFVMLIATCCLACVSFAEEAAKAPSLLTTPVASSDEPALMRAPWESARDDQWHSDVEDALRYLHTRQEHTIDRVEKLEKAMIQVRTTSGQTVARSVQLVQGQGAFSLAPGETLTGYQDVYTGRWVSLSSQPSQVARYIGQSPVMSYPSRSMEIRTVAPMRSYQPMRGAIRVSSCAGGRCG